MVPELSSLSTTLSRRTSELRQELPVNRREILERTSELNQVLSDLPVTSHAFFGRILELSQLRMMLSLQPGEIGRKAVVLWGLGGFGKTRIALQYLRMYQKYYTAILWINAATFESAEESFTQVASVLASEHASEALPPSAGTRGSMRVVQQ